MAASSPSIPLARLGPTWADSCICSRRNRRQVDSLGAGCLSDGVFYDKELALPALVDQSTRAVEFDADLMWSRKAVYVTDRPDQRETIC